MIEYTLPLRYLGVAQLGARYLGVVEAAGSSPVTQTKKSPMVAKLSDFFVFLLSFKMAFGARIVQDFFVFFPPVVEAGAKKRAFCPQKKETKKWLVSKKETTVITL